MLRKILKGAAALLAVVLVLGAVGWFGRFEIMRLREGLPAFSHAGGSTQSEMVAMRDGVLLATTVYQPDGAGPWPAVMIRNPYEGFDFIVGGWCQLLTRYGYVCVYQDVRGQGESEGKWEPLFNEREDGIDALAWLTKQSFQDGNIGMMGPSYLAAVQWAVAGDLPSEVKTLIPAVFTTQTYDTLYLDGMFRHESFTAWTFTMPGRGMRRDTGDEYAKAIRHRPHNEVGERYFGAPLAWYQDWIGSPSRRDPYWQQEEIKYLSANPERINVPILMIGGWYDVFFGPQFKDWERLATQSESRFVIGPWTHIGQSGEAVDTPNAGGGLTQWSLVLDWFGHHLKGEALANPPGISVYSMGTNEWLEHKAWPPRTKAIRFYLGNDGDPHACAGGSLRGEAAQSGGEVKFVYDPEDPVPTRGGSGMLAFILPGFDGAPPANVWQGDLCKREDILSYVSEPLSGALHIAGAIKVALTVASTAPDTSFTAKLVEVYPDGRAVNIRDGVTTLAYRNGSDDPQGYDAGSPVELTLEFWPIDWNVAAGSRLRLDVSSSDFPKFHAHSNRAGVWSAQTDSVKAEQRVYTGAATQSWLELPIVAGH
jgi:putative CocE/NonD family hydrolase